MGSGNSIELGFVTLFGDTAAHESEEGGGGGVQGDQVLGVGVRWEEVKEESLWPGRKQGALY